MPKGVEHAYPAGYWAELVRVRKSVMPKGVEHMVDGINQNEFERCGNL